jgi:hypothetical protein
MSSPFDISLLSRNGEQSVLNLRELGTTDSTKRNILSWKGMKMNRFRSLITVCLLASLIYQPLYAQELTRPAFDVIAPTLMHTPVSEQIPLGNPIEITISATDNTGIKDVILFYRVIGEDNFEQLPMIRTGRHDNYAAIVPVERIRVPGIEYYVQAEDLAGNKVLRGFDFSPLKVFVVSHGLKQAVVATPIPSENTQEATGNKKSSTVKWVLIGLGAAAVAGLGLALGGGGSNGGGSGGGADTGTVNIDATIPE